MHELCHAIGLKHPHEKGMKGRPRFPGLNSGSDEFSDKGDFGQNAHPFTQMGCVDKSLKMVWCRRIMLKMVLKKNLY